MNVSLKLENMDLYFRSWWIYFRVFESGLVFTFLKKIPLTVFILHLLYH